MCNLFSRNRIKFTVNKDIKNWYMTKTRWNSQSDIALAREREYECMYVCVCVWVLLGPAARHRWCDYVIAVRRGWVAAEGVQHDWRTATVQHHHSTASVCQLVLCVCVTRLQVSDTVNLMVLRRPETFQFLKSILIVNFRVLNLDKFGVYILSLSVLTAIFQECLHSEFCWELWLMEVVVITGGISHAVKSSPSANQHSTFCCLDVLPVTQPTVSKHWRESVFIESTELWRYINLSIIIIMCMKGCMCIFQLYNIVPMRPALLRYRSPVFTPS